MGTIPARGGLARLTCDYKVISVQLQLQLPTGTELGKIKGTLLSQTLKVEEKKVSLVV